MKLHRSRRHLKHRYELSRLANVSAREACTQPCVGENTQQLWSLLPPLSAPGLRPLMHPGVGAHPRGLHCACPVGHAPQVNLQAVSARGEDRFCFVAGFADVLAISTVQLFPPVFVHDCRARMQRGRTAARAGTSYRLLLLSCNEGPIPNTEKQVFDSTESGESTLPHRTVGVASVWTDPVAAPTMSTAQGITKSRTTPAAVTICARLGIQQGWY